MHLNCLSKFDADWADFDAMIVASVDKEWL